MVRRLLANALRLLVALFSAVCVYALTAGEAALDPVAGWPLTAPIVLALLVQWLLLEHVLARVVSRAARRVARGR